MISETTSRSWGWAVWAPRGEVEGVVKGVRRRVAEHSAQRPAALLTTRPNTVVWGQAALRAKAVSRGHSRRVSP